METQIQNSELQGKKVIILGGSVGIGLATAIAADSAGAEVIIVSSNQQRIDQALKQLSSHASGQAIDLSKEENIKNFFANIGKFDHLVYTAGENLTLNLLAETDIDKARQFWNLRYWMALASVKYATPNINAGGSINLTSGNAGLRPSAGWTVAASICMAMDGLVRALAVELAPIRVNAVAPGIVKTNLWDGMPEADRNNLFENVGKALPVRRVGEAEDIAKTFIYMMTQTYGTGQMLVVDGGNVLV